MNKISDVVQTIVASSEVVYSALSDGILNLSAYARTIRREVEGKAKKPVRLGSIVVALSRLARKIMRGPSLIPEIVVDSMSVKSGLVEITFDKSEANRARLQLLYRDQRFIAADFFAVTQGASEISVVVPEPLGERVLKFYQRQKPKLFLANLASLTVAFDQKYLNTPNTIFAILRNFALRRVNVVEIISTYTELTFLLRQDDLEKSFLMMNSRYRSREKKR